MAGVVGEVSGRQKRERRRFALSGKGVEDEVDAHGRKGKGVLFRTSCCGLTDVKTGKEMMYLGCSVRCCLVVETRLQPAGQGLVLFAS